MSSSEGVLRVIPHHWTLTAALLAICWGSVGLVWVVGAFVANSRPSPPQQRVSRVPIWLVSMVLIGLLGRVIPATVWTALTVDRAWLRAVGVVCLLLSTALTLWARWVLGRMWSDSVEVRGEHVLHTDGPYRVTRHPIYTGILGMLVGSLLLSGFGIWLLYCIGGFIVIVGKIPTEERGLRETHGRRYADYQRRVPSVIPGFHLPREDRSSQRRGRLPPDRGAMRR
jgi:protein-S-isoprenylcysteine O-methyltransferase Ste14